MNAIKNFFEDENGVAAIEYALLGGLVAVVVATTATLLSNQAMQMFKNIAENIISIYKQ